MNQVQTSTAGNNHISQSVIEAVAEAEQIDPVELSPTLFQIVDPDALDEIFASVSTDDQREGQVVFTYIGYEVTVSSEGVVSVEPLAE